MRLRKPAATVQPGLFTNLAKIPIAGDNPVGENIRDTAIFHELRAELQKPLLATNSVAINWHLVAHQTKLILETKSKDLLVAAYFVIAHIHSKREEGWSEALEFYTVLINTYGTQLQPSQKPKVQVSAINWLVSELSKQYELDKMMIDLVTQQRIYVNLRHLQQVVEKTFAQNCFANMIKECKTRIEVLQKSLERAPQESLVRANSTTMPAANTVAQTTLVTETDQGNGTLPPNSRTEILNELHAISQRIAALYCRVKQFK
jgi:hypothetical protein